MLDKNLLRTRFSLVSSTKCQDFPQMRFVFPRLFLNFNTYVVTFARKTREMEAKAILLVGAIN